MFKIIVLSLFLCSTGTYAASTLDLICSGKIGYLNQTDRNIEFISTSYSCDSAIIRGYYTFGPNRQIPNICPVINSCGSDAPLWTIDEQPSSLSPGPVDLKLCSSISTTGDDEKCNFRCNLNITAAYCANINSIVYEVKPVPICNARFCYKSLIPCGDNESSSTGFEPNCITSFPFYRLDNATKTTTYGIKETDKRFKNIDGISLLCSIKCTTQIDCSQIGGQVLWFIKTKPSAINKTELYYDADSNELYSYLEESIWSQNINNYFYCSIKPSVDGMQPFKSLITPVYYAGLVLQLNDTKGITEHRYPDTNEISIQLNEVDANSALLTVYSSLPITCGEEFTSCGLKVQMAAETIFKEYDPIRVANCNPSGDCGACAKTIANQTVPDPKNSVTYQIFATIEEKNMRNPDKMKLSLKTKYHYSLASMIFQDLMLPIVNVEFIPKNSPIVESYSLNDPHLLTHDGTKIEFHGRDGEYLVLENERALLRIHMINKLCSPGSYVYCNFGIYIQSMDDFVYFEKSSSDTLFYKDLSNPFSPTIKLVFDVKTGYAQIPKESAVKVFIENSYFMLSTHFATRVKINRYSGNFYINPSKYDLGSVYGLFGNYNKDKKDDVLETKCGRVKNLVEYFDCYKIKKPFLAKNEFYNLTNGNSDPTQYCMCVNSENGTIVCPLGLRLEESVKYRQRSNDKTVITMNDLDNITKKSNIFIIENNIQNQERRRKRSEESLGCVKTLNITIFQECSEQELIDLKSLIQLCEEDVKSTGEDIWAETYYDFAMDSCKEKLSGDQTNFVNTSNGESVPQSGLLKQLCTNDCNGNGNCIEGVCYCFAPYDGFDCLIDTSKPLEIYNYTASNTSCSLNSTLKCLDVLLLINRVTRYLVIKTDIYYRKENATKFELLNKESSKVYTMGNNIIYAKLIGTSYLIPYGALSIYYLNITLHDNSTSESLFYKVYDDDCHECIDDMNCSIKPNKCDIDSVCYDADNVNPLNKLQICDPSKSYLSWTNIKSNSNKINSSFFIIFFFSCLFTLFR